MIKEEISNQNLAGKRAELASEFAELQFFFFLSNSL